jgi:hypothetical protein
MKRPRRDDDRLLRRLAITAPDTAVARRPPARLVIAGLASASVLGLAALILAQGAGRSRSLAYVLVALVLIGCVVAFAWVLPQAFGVASRALGPLGLRVVATPAYAPNNAAGGGRLDGAVVYGGERHGRRVEISQTPAEALTVVHLGGRRWGPPTGLPSNASEMSRLTGEPAGAWRHVVVELGPAHVAVRRRRSGAGGWLLYDLLLAEVVADRH